MADVDVSPGVSGPGYIALGVQCEPLDQTDLKDGVDATLGIRIVAFTRKYSGFVFL
jgi:hypothetical protein